VQNLDIAGLGKATLLEAVGTTQNMKGEKMLDKMSARCENTSTERACLPMIFSTIDTRDIDKGHMLPPENVITAMREKEHKQHVQRISYLLMQTAKRGKR
jgi:hypothetical protein